MPKPSIALNPLVMIRTFSARLRVIGRSSIGRPARTRIRAHHALARACEKSTAARDALGSQDGFLLLEVIISALLVGLIVIATFTGFDAVNRASADQRYHAEATVLAGQSQEQLRTDSAEVLDELQSTSHVYTQVVDGTTYTITEKAYFVNDSLKSSGCSAVGGVESKQHGDYVETVSSVTWPQLVRAKRPAVSQFSYITPPAGSGLEVDVTNGGKPESPVEGVTAKVNEAEAVTGAAGCLIFGGIPATTASVEVHRLGYVTRAGAFVVSSKEVSIAPNLITHYPVILNEGGTITAEFTYKGKATYSYENAKHEKIAEPVTGDTFVVHNTEMGVAPEFEMGSTAGKFNTESEWEATPGEYKTSATTPIEPAHYPKGNLFPLASPGEYMPAIAPKVTQPTALKKSKKKKKSKTEKAPSRQAQIPKCQCRCRSISSASGTARKPAKMKAYRKHHTRPRSQMWPARKPILTTSLSSTSCVNRKR